MTTTGRPKDHLATVEAFHRLDGRTFLSRIRDGALPPAPIFRLMGLELVEVDFGFVAFRGVPAASHYNPLGTVHGGFAATLLDSALGCAVHSALPADRIYTTVDIGVKLLRAITVDTGVVRAEATAEHVGRRLGIAAGRVTDVEGRVLATGTTTCLLLPAPATPKKDTP